MSGTLTVTGMSSGLPSGQKVIGPVTMTGSNPVGAINDATLTAGDNVFTLPPGAAAVAIFLGQSPAVTVKVRTNLNASDAGLEVAPFGNSQGWAAFPLVGGTTQVILNASAALAGVELSFI